ncbi:MAG: GtrA family protein [Microvirga sp.]
MNELVRRIRSFVAVGLIGFVVDAGLLAVGTTLLSMGPRVSRVISFLAAVLVTWVLNRTFTFADRASRRKTGELLRYGFTSVVSAFLNLGAYFLALPMLPDNAVAPYIALVFGGASGLMSNFVLYRLVVFR